MADPKPSPKMVQVNGLGVVQFPGTMADDEISSVIKKHKSQTHSSSPHFTGKTTEESEHARQLKPAQPLSSAIPKMPDWANAPLMSAKDLEETPEAQKRTEASQKAFTSAHPKVAKFLEKGDNPAVLGAMEGTQQFTEGMTSPANLALVVGAPESKLLSAFFSIQALKGSYANAKQAQEAYNKGQNQEAIKYATEAALGLGVAGLAGHHAVKDIPVPEPVRKFVADETGSVTNPLAPKIPDVKAKAAELKPTTAEPTLYHGSTGTVSELTPGSMLTPDKAWAAGYTTKTLPNGEEHFIGKVHATTAPSGNLLHVVGSLHDAESTLINMGKGIGATSGGLEGIANAVHNHYGYDAIVSKDAQGKTTGAIVLKNHPVSGVHDPMQAVTEAQKRGAPVASNLQQIIQRESAPKPTTAYKSADQSQPFYLKSENLVSEKMKGPMPAEDVHKMLLSNGVKPEEMKWTGLDSLLQGKGKQKVTPQEIQEHLAGNNLQIKEVTKGRTDNRAAIEDLDKKIEEVNHKFSVSNKAERDALFSEREALSEQRRNLVNTDYKGQDTKFGQYALPGASNYRELLLTMPRKEVTTGDVAQELFKKSARS